MRKWFWVVGALVVLGFLTLVPAANPAGKSNLLGYQSICPAAPISSLTLWAAAAALYYYIRRRV